jgi:hypothetical protein
LLCRSRFTLSANAGRDRSGQASEVLVLWVSAAQRRWGDRLHFFRGLNSHPDAAVTLDPELAHRARLALPRQDGLGSGWPSAAPIWPGALLRLFIAQRATGYRFEPPDGSSQMARLARAEARFSARPRLTLSRRTSTMPAQGCAERSRRGRGSPYGRVVVSRKLPLSRMSVGTSRLSPVLRALALPRLASSSRIGETRREPLPRLE